jgi:hypothetical protein
MEPLNVRMITDLLQPHNLLFFVGIWFGRQHKYLFNKLADHRIRKISSGKADILHRPLGSLLALCLFVHTRMIHPMSRRPRDCAKKALPADPHEHKTSSLLSL